MNKKHFKLFFVLGIFVAFSLACRLTAELPWEAGGQDVQISAEDVAAAATKAAEAAATAGVLSGQAGNIAGTAVAQGSDLVATAQVFPTPTINLPPGATALERKLATIQPDANGNFTLDITDADLNEYVGGQTGGGFQAEGFSVDDVQVSITSESAKLIGEIKQPVAVPLEVAMKPTVENGHLHFDIISATVGLFPAPESMLDLIEITANNEFTQALAGLPANTTLQDVQLGEGVLTITGRQQ